MAIDTIIMSISCARKLSNVRIGVMEQGRLTRIKREVADRADYRNVIKL
jgi:hypothetical protein